jgi:hypothetical protein
MQKYPYPPGKRDQGDCYNRSLPALPTRPFEAARNVYAKDKVFNLFRRRNHPTPEIIRIQVLEPDTVGYGKLAQTVVAVVEDGPRNLQNRKVVVKFFDPLYLNPDSLQCGK